MLTSVQEDDFRRIIEMFEECLILHAENPNSEQVEEQVLNLCGAVSDITDLDVSRLQDVNSAIYKDAINQLRTEVFRQKDQKVEEKFCLRTPEEYNNAVCQWPPIYRAVELACMFIRAVCMNSINVPRSKKVAFKAKNGKQYLNGWQLFCETYGKVVLAA